MAVKTTFFDEMRGFIVVYLVFGLWPAWKNNKYKWLLIIYSFFSIILVFIIFVSAVFVNKILEYRSLSAAVDYSFFCSISITHFIIVLQSLIQRKFQMKLINKFTHVDRLFHTKLHVRISYRNERRILFLRFVLMLSTFIGIKTGLMIHLYAGNSLNSFWFHCLYSVWIARLRSVQVLCFVHLLRARLILVNDKIKEILTTRNLYTGIANDGHSIFNTRNPVSILDKSMPKFSIYDRLLNLKEIYGELYEICELINITYGWSLLAIITQCFIDFTSNSYWTFLALEQTPAIITTAIDSISLLIPVVIVLSLLAYYCSSCARYVSESVLAWIVCNKTDITQITLYA